METAEVMAELVVAAPTAVAMIVVVWLFLQFMHRFLDRIERRDKERDEKFLEAQERYMERMEELHRDSRQLHRESISATTRATEVLERVGRILGEDAKHAG